MYGNHTGRRRRAARPASVTGALAALAALAVLSGCTMSSRADEPVPTGPPTQRPKDSVPYWVNPDGPAAQQVAAYRRDGQKKDARLIHRIAEQPVAEWLGVDDAEGQARGFTLAAAAADREALLVVYDIPHRDCGQYSQGGAADGATYRDWLAGVARGIGDRPATVILEPDALPHVVDGCTPPRYHEERYDLLWGAVATLKALPHTKVYLDAGNPHWMKDPGRLVEPLRRAGIDRADGFALNIANFQTTEENRAFGRRLSRMLGGKHFVIDTGRNGNGVAPGDDPQTWCNPDGRALGTPPTTDTGDDLVDAYLWIKRPGESDGTCKGGPAAGRWWPEYALDLAHNTEEKDGD
ncbi:glycoside hydrolase family 6 protein [Streptomyces sp. B1866]|uniref:glycoside hydrolase family 6 protein n=1 Tax=Streptomyces sp. B1866 TaxID=3075431 RepID=UPI002891FBC4|nr:glycoside hydrolase family 6 protein [Streptomyces sp. B1866]MDT3396623.1 glycoside hydrolase family 6 protein [Streptomyces sp. B1866]